MLDNYSMKLLILSDLHLELGPLPLQEGGRRIDEEVDVVVLAGDVMDGPCGPEWARKAFPDKRIVMVSGNHDLYDQHWDIGIRMLRSEARRYDIDFLENDSVVIDGVLFLGCSLWTDYALHGQQLLGKRMLEMPGLMTDFREISLDGGQLSPVDVLARHQASRQWLQGELQACDFARTVVVTHHAPHPRSIDRFDALKPVAAAYASDLTDLMGYAALWVHGHVHEAADYEISGTRVVCNPRGYLDRDGDALSGWDPCFTVDI